MTASARCEAGLPSGFPCGKPAAYAMYARCPDCGAVNNGRGICVTHAAQMRLGQLLPAPPHCGANSYDLIKITTWTS